MTTRGGWVIAAMLASALAASAWALAYHYRIGHRAAQFWGPESARLLYGATELELVQVRPAAADSPDGTTITIGGAVYLASGRRDVSHAPGMSNARRALTVDATFDAAPADDPNSPIAWILICRQGEREAKLLFGAGCRWTASAAVPNRRAILVERSARALQNFFDEQFAGDRGGAIRGRA